ncbi:hypothetical protein CH330_06785 [candidate division WOR-3 bacterium JGI_Cruoil_03_51_56]|uniref:Glycerol-3-phosphate acyltransferase n=1 Tax=candidate division WOR-3 bacterium JGI_Cruoil_03_51_56 TaxID=1973747 RepID=A0A235BRB3_UNCW3|nr:MAG: hypothetical protein CH330_06785 [candidate division WOR-3 bacterium JGI_Cruoil_03_51_56]
MVKVLAILAGYLIGSISPSYILGRLVKGIDIREHGTRINDTTNAFRVLGPGIGMATVLFNTGKGLVAMLIAYLLGLPAEFVFASGAAAIIGHLLPFYLRFRGGQGVTTASALLIVNLFFLVPENPFPWHLNALIGLTALLMLLITRRLEVLGLTVVPLLAFMLIRYVPSSPLLFYTLGLLAFICAVSIINTVRKRLLVPDEYVRTKVKLWRFLTRPAAMSFPIFLFAIGRAFTLILLAIVTLVFVIMDITRLSVNRVNLFLLKKAAGTFKKSEQTRISSMTGFLLASLVVMFIFKRTVAFYAITFLIFGDFFAKYFGLQFGRTRLFNKTVEGTMAHLVACLVAGFIVNEFIPLSPWIIIAGAVTGTVFEVLPLNIDDNLTVGITSATAMHFALTAIPSF